MRQLASTIAILLLMTCSACGVFGGDDDIIEPPAELIEFTSEMRVQRLWSSRVGGESERLRLGLSPATDGASIFAGTYDGRVSALNADSGRAIWSVRLDIPLSAGPSYADGVLVFGTADGEIVLLSAADGTVLWRQPVGSEVLAPPAIGQDVVALRTVDGRLTGLSVSDGRELWSVEQNLPALTLRGDTPPQIAGQVVVSGFDNGRIGAYDLAAGTTIWEIPIANPTGTNELERLVDVSSGLQIVGTNVYTVGYQGRAVDIDLATGFVIWQQDVSSFAGIGVDVNNVYITDDVSSVIALSRAGGTVLWRQEALRLRDVSAPTRFGRAVVVGDLEGYLHWLDPQDGHFLARARAASGRISSAPLVVGQTLYVQAEDGTIAAFAVRDESA